MTTDNEKNKTEEAYRFKYFNPKDIAPSERANYRDEIISILKHCIKQDKTETLLNFAKTAFAKMMLAIRLVCFAAAIAVGTLVYAKTSQGERVEYGWLTVFALLAFVFLNVVITRIVFSSAYAEELKKRIDFYKKIIRQIKRDYHGF